MSDETPPPEPKERPSAVDSAREFSAGVLGSIQTRLELLSNELAEERARLEKIVMYGVMFVGTGIISMILLTFSPLLLFEDEASKKYAFVVIFGIYVLTAFGSGLALRHYLVNRPKPFSATIEELRKDRDRLRGVHHPDPPPQP
ncbi:MAG: phage holin family protein [Verrucomicrobiota bacterium]